MAIKSYEKNSIFWKNKKPKIMGDFLGRTQVLKLLGSIKGKRILDAGCGTGYMAKKMAKKGAIVYGCDVEDKMLKIAVEDEKSIKQGISYKKANISKTGYPSNFFDAIVCTGVLIHNNRRNISLFFKEVERILKKKGILLFYINHPSLYIKGSPSRNNQENWIKHFLIKGKEDYSKSALFREHYLDINGKEFISNVWHHPLEFYLNEINRSGLKISLVKELIVKKEHLLLKTWGESFNYPAFLLFKLEK